MGKYKHTQIGWFVAALFIGSWLFMVFCFLKGIGNNPLTIAPLLALSGIFIIVVLIFYKLTVEIDDENITVKFGIGMARKVIPLSDIEKVETTRNKWWYGLGIRMIENGWMWNIWGLDAVELSFKSQSKIFRIGSDDAETLRNEIQKRLN